MQSFVCPVCGGKLHIVIETGLAVCEACQRTFDAEAEDVQKYREIYLGAERAMRQNTVAGFREAVEKLDAIPFVVEAQKKKAFCVQRLEKLEAMQRGRQECERRSEAKDTKLGIILLILTLLFAAAAIAGIVYLIILWSKGMLSRPAVIVIASVAVIAVALALFGRLRGGN